MKFPETIRMRKLISAFGVLFIRAKGTKYWKLFIKGMQFIIHFISVMLLLSCGAAVLAVLEDPDIMYGKDTNALQEGNGSVRNSTASKRSKGSAHHDHESSSNQLTHFWESIQSKYDVSINEKSFVFLMEDMRNYLENDLKQKSEHKAPRIHIHHSQGHIIRDRRFIFMKWFYFATIATTTIGYGHVYPKTNEGKLFFIFFSIIGIVSMMTLLRSCGKILMTGNKKLYTKVSRCICKRKEYVSDQLMSVVSMCVFFLVFMLFVVWYDQHIGTHLEGTWALIDTFYYWVVTCTTVGFGDKHFPLEVEIEHFYELLLFRVFGLSFLAAIIETIHVYIKYRRKLLIIQSRRRLRKISHALIPYAAKLQEGQVAECL